MEATDDKQVAKMMGLLRALNPGDAFAINRRIKETSLEHLARRLLKSLSVDATEPQIIAALSGIHGERGGPAHFKSNRDVKAELDARWNVVTPRHVRPSSLMRTKKIQNA